MQARGGGGMDATVNPPKPRTTGAMRLETLSKEHDPFRFLEPHRLMERMARPVVEMRVRPQLRTALIPRPGPHRVQQACANTGAPVVGMHIDTLKKRNG